MKSQAKMIGERLREIRTVMEISTATMAQVTGVSEAEYIAHENGEVDSHISFLYDCAKKFGVDLSAIVRGESAKLSSYTLTRAGSGVSIERSHEFVYQQLAADFKKRLTEPLLVKAKPEIPGQPIPLSVHPGQEFDYILKGKLKVLMEGKTEILSEGDSIYFDSNQPHGLVAYECDECEFLAIVIQGDAREAAKPVAVSENKAEATPAEERIYQKFTDEVVDENGHLVDISFHWPENFNFAYDVVDELALKKPDKLAMAWVSKEHVRRDFTFFDIAVNSCKVANYLTSLGIRKGDRVTVSVDGPSEVELFDVLCNHFNCAM